MGKHIPSGGHTKKGKFKPQNLNKYVGNPDDIWFRSSWEYKFMIYCDSKKEVLKWGSEVITIPYYDKDGNKRRYIPDFYMETADKNTEGLINKWLIEVKPFKETYEPVIPKNISEKKYKKLEYDLKTWWKNSHKWAFTIEWCKERDMKFRLVTEKQLDNFKI